MADTNKEKTATTKKTKTAAEINAFMQHQEKLKEKFSATKDAFQLVDLTKSESRTFTIFSKDVLRTYMKNPKSNENNLRSLSQFLYRLSHNYRRIIHYYAEMIDMSSYMVIPQFESLEKSDPTKMVDEYYKTALQVEKMNMSMHIIQALLIAWREDCFYGYTYEDESGFFIIPLDGKYCRVSSSNYDGTLNFAFDFSYFRSNPIFLEYWDKEFTTKYNAFEKDSSLRWQELDPSRTMCLKINIDDKTLVTPPFLPLFESIIDLIDLQSIQALKDELSVYKLLVAKMDTLQGSNEPDDFSVDVNTAIAYYNRLSASLPEGVNSCLSPLDIETIEFKDDQTEDVNRVSSSMSNLFQLAGVSQILDSPKISGSTAFEASIACDTLMATKILLPQIEAWVNRYLTYVMGDHAKVKYMEVSPYTKSKKISELQSAAQYGVPVKIPLAVLQGFSPLEIASMQCIENALGVNDWKPLQSSHTTSQTGDGDNTKDVSVDGLTPEGEETRDQDKNDKG